MIILVVAVFTFAGLLGTAFAPWLLINEPLWYIALSPGLQNVALVAPQVAATPLFVLATLRRTSALLSTYWLGGLYGHRMVRWIQERYPRMGAFVRFYESLFGRFGVALLIVAPIHTAAGLAGAAGCRALPFLFAATVGQMVQVGLTIALGDEIARWTKPLVAWLGQYVLEATAVCVCLVLLQISLTRYRTGRWSVFAAE
jgi:hypothetical protein